MPAFTAALFLSALLLFSAQPIITKMILPRWGGSPAVWNTAVLFFQTLLFAGYLYAHAIGRLTTAVQSLIHFPLLALAFVALPFVVGAGAGEFGARSPVLPLLTVLTVSIGLPFLAVSATAPLLIRWFSRTGHADAADPYFLYGVSNFGSLLALLAYPTIVEPRLGLVTQGRAWIWGYVALVLMIGLCAVVASTALRSRKRHPKVEDRQQSAGDITWRQRGAWLVLSAVPASLLLGVTLHISTDIAATPLLWVMPLALYLLSFVLAFARRRVIRQRWVLQAQVISLALLAVHFNSAGLWLGIPLHLVAFFTTNLMCQGELADRRPGPVHSTEFFVWISAGGLLGGSFSVLVAPLLFRSVLEYPLLLAVACLLRSTARRGTPRTLLLDLTLATALAASYLVPTAVFGFRQPDSIRSGGLVYYGAVVLVLCGFRSRPLGLMLAFAAIVLGPSLMNDAQRVVARERSFFGVHTVELRNNGSLHVLKHGTTIHGAQLLDPRRWRTPLIYYAPGGSLEQALAALNDRGALETIGVVGLGTGAISCYLRPGQRMTFFEIDPTVERLARDTRYFHFLEECGSNVEVVIGDGRLSLAKTPDDGFDLLIIDAFSSDAVPAHLMTREALALYFRKLAPGGLVLFHISNDFMDLRPVLAALVSDGNLQGRIRAHWPEQAPATWVALAENADSLTAGDGSLWWDPLEPQPGHQVWTDDYADVLGTLNW